MFPLHDSFLEDLDRFNYSDVVTSHTKVIDEIKLYLIGNMDDIATEFIVKNTESKQWSPLSSSE